MDFTTNKFMVNYKYKDRLFRLIFQDKKHLLSLYNAIHGTSYYDPNDLEITTIDDVIYMKMKNDLSFIVDSCMSLYEHQSTLNPNMPIRGLMYFGKLYSQHIMINDVNVYSSKLQKIPTPQYYVFYNGDKKTPERSVLKLSDAFENPLDEDLYEWSAIMLNINYGKNKDLLDNCHILKEYAYFVDCIKEELRIDKDIKRAVTTAVDRCISEGILSEILMKHKSEVIEVCLTEYDEKKVLQALAKEAEEEGRAEGRAEGQMEGRLNAYLEMFSEGIITEEQFEKYTGKSIKDYLTDN